MEDQGHQAMWPQMIAALAAIDAALGLPEDGCNSLAKTLAEIARLKKAEAKTNSYIVDNARLSERVAQMRTALEWYRDEAMAMAKNMAGGAHTAGVLASVTVLSLDAGQRAMSALGPNVMSTTHL